MNRSRYTEVQDIFREYGPAYRRNHESSMPRRMHRAMRAIKICRTSELGGHMDECDTCKKIRISYNSCRNRHCPKCQFLKKEKWLEDRLNDFLPIRYFHVVFTIPDLLNPIVLRNQTVLYNILFKSASETLKELSADKKYIGAQIGFTAVLHTWGQNLMDHPHLHCVVTGGGLSPNKQNWISSGKNFFLPVKVMSRLFRGKFMAYLKESYETGRIKFPGSISYLKKRKNFYSLISALYNREWVVYSKPPFKNPENVFRYLSQYTHRIAISNHRILKIENNMVFFKWRDYSDNNKNKVMALDVNEFIRRFLLHVLPDRYVKIRHYGLYGNRNRKPLLDRCRKILGVEPLSGEKTVQSWEEILLSLCGFDVRKCPFCGKGEMVPAGIILPKRCNSP